MAVKDDLPDYTKQAISLLYTYGDYWMLRSDECVGDLAYWLMYADERYDPAKGAKEGTWRIFIARCRIRHMRKIRYRNRQVCFSDYGETAKLFELVYQRKYQKPVHEADIAGEILDIVISRTKSLSKRQLAIVDLMRQGFSQTAVANKFGISKQAISCSVKDILKKCRVSMRGISQSELIEREMLMSSNEVSVDNTNEQTTITLSDDQFEIRFRAQRGCRFSHNDAERIGPELIRLKNANGGVITKSVILESATEEDSILHQDFEWNDETAAQKHRVEQAGYMLRSIMIVWDEADPNDDTVTVEKEFRMFHHVHAPAADSDTDVDSVTEARQPNSVPVYVTFPDVVNNPDYSAQVIADAERYLQQFSNKYQSYLEQIPAFRQRFESIFNALQEMDE